MFEKRNHNVVEAKGSIPYWVIAERIGVHENTVQNWMKKKMSAEREKIVMRAIADIKEEIGRKGDV